MSINHFKYMELALRAESLSDHEDHKVGALIRGKYNNGDAYEIARSNFWPKLLKDHIGEDKKLGNASTTVHAEVAAICAAPATENADIYITDLPCPNCAKVIAESKIKNVYLDDHAYNTPLGIKIRPYFDEVSSLILGSANINVFKMNVLKKTIDQIITVPKNALTNIQRPIKHIAIDNADINQNNFMKMVEQQRSERAFAACFTKSLLGQYSFMFAQSHRSTGLSEKTVKLITDSQSKYEATLQPINRLLLSCARYGVKINPEYLYSSQTPTSREFVNMIGAGYSTLTIGDKNKCRDEWGLKALSQLQKHKIIELN